jgi:spectrin beta
MATVGGTRLKQINEIADELVAGQHSQSANILRRQEQVNGLWTRLLAARDRKAAALARAEGVAEFERMCDQTRAWMNDKSASLNDPVDGKDLVALQVSHPFFSPINHTQAQQRRHQNMERELRPVEEQMRHLRDLANKVKADNPALASEIERRIQNLERMWMELNKTTVGRRHLLEESQGQQMFQVSSP